MIVPKIKPVPNLPKYKWNPEAGNYINASGRFVKRNEIRDELDNVLDGITSSMAGLSDDLLNGSINLVKWQKGMMDLSKQSHIIGASMQKGGFYQMTDKDFGKVGSIIKQEYKKLNSFANDIASGKQPFNGNIRRISKLFGQNSRQTYNDFAKNSALGKGFDLEKSTTTPADHCVECVSQEAKGWVKMGNLIPIGERICRSNCKCILHFKNSKTSETKIA